jgi:hypothetical protein
MTRPKRSDTQSRSSQVKSARPKRSGVRSMDMYQSEKAIGAVRKGKRTTVSATRPATIVAASMRNQLPLTQTWYPRYGPGSPCGQMPVRRSSA